MTDVNNRVYDLQGILERMYATRSKNRFETLKKISTGSFDGAGKASKRIKFIADMFAHIPYSVHLLEALRDIYEQVEKFGRKPGDPVQDGDYPTSSYLRSAFARSFGDCSAARSNKDRIRDIHKAFKYIRKNGVNPTKLESIVVGVLKACLNQSQKNSYGYSSVATTQACRMYATICNKLAAYVMYNLFDGQNRVGSQDNSQNTGDKSVEDYIDKKVVAGNVRSEKEHDFSSTLAQASKIAKESMMQKKSPDTSDVINVLVDLAESVLGVGPLTQREPTSKDTGQSKPVRVEQATEPSTASAVKQPGAAKSVMVTQGPVHSGLVQRLTTNFRVDQAGLSAQNEQELKQILWDSLREFVGLSGVIYQTRYNSNGKEYSQYFDRHILSEINTTLVSIDLAISLEDSEYNQVSAGLASYLEAVPGLLKEYFNKQQVQSRVLSTVKQFSSEELAILRNMFREGKL